MCRDRSPPANEFQPFSNQVCAVPRPQKHPSDVSEGHPAVMHSANSTAPITAISLVDILPSEENARNTTSKNKYQLSSNITAPMTFYHNMR